MLVAASVPHPVSNRQALRSAQATKSLDVSGAPLHNEQLQALAEALQLWPAVASLSIKGTGVTDEVGGGATASSAAIITQANASLRRV